MMGLLRNTGEPPPADGAIRCRSPNPFRVSSHSGDARSRAYRTVGATFRQFWPGIDRLAGWTPDTDTAPGAPWFISLWRPIVHPPLRRQGRRGPSNFPPSSLRSIAGKSVPPLAAAGGRVPRSL